MGYPDKPRAIYDKLVFDLEDSLYDIMGTLYEIKTLDMLSKLDQPTEPEN